MPLISSDIGDFVIASVSSRSKAITFLVINILRLMLCLEASLYQLGRLADEQESVFAFFEQYWLLNHVVVNDFFAIH